MGPGPRPRAPLPAGRASLSLGAACQLLQPETTHGHTRRNGSTLAREWGFHAPLLAGTNRCRLRWPLRCVTAPRACEPRPARRAGARRDPLAWATLAAGLGAGAKARARRERRCGALLPALRAPGSPASGSTRVGARVPPSRRSRFTSHAVSRKAGARGRIEVPSSVPKPRHAGRMTPPSGQGPRPPHAASVEALLGGARAFWTVSAPPGSDEPSGRRGSPRRVQGAEAPGTKRRAAPVTASTTESARGQMCRELHGLYFLRNGAACNMKMLETITFNAHLLSTELSTESPLFVAPYRSFLLRSARNGAHRRTLDRGNVR